MITLSMPISEMTPIERKQRLEAGLYVDRYPALPFLSEIKCQLTGISVEDFWTNGDKLAHTEETAFNRFGYDRIVIGPNTTGITSALGGQYVFAPGKLPALAHTVIQTETDLHNLTPINWETCPELEVFRRAASLLAPAAKHIVPVELSIGGPLTIASMLRGIEPLLKDCRRNPDFVNRLLRFITDNQKRCIRMAAHFGFGIAMADPVANPGLIGAKRYETFVFPYTKELTEYAIQTTGHKVSLHMCGDTCSIWNYLSQYSLNEISLDNIIDLRQAAVTLGSHVPIAGNVDPVHVLMNGTKETITSAVIQSIENGRVANCGYHLASGCDIPFETDLSHVDWFMEAARNIPYR